MDQYANFDLVIDRQGERFVARVIDSPAGEASYIFDFPFSRLELENYLLRFGHARKTVRRIDSPQTEAAREFGGKLYDTVFGDEVKTCFRRALDEVDRQDPPQGLRVRVRFEDALDMADLPWEFLYSKNLDEFLVHSTRTPLVRYIDLPDRTRPLDVEPPLRILVMVSSPTDVVELNTEEEYQRLANELSDLVQKGAVVVERLDEANLSALQKKLRQFKPHIFHYIGHGGYDVARDDGVLMLEDDKGRGQAVSGHELGTILRDHRSLRLAFLNSCEGARNSTSDPFAGTAQSLIRKGIPAVVAMQFEISDDAAILFAHEFYAAIADGYAVDAASAEARKVMLGIPGVEWATPVLTMRAPDGKIFNLTKEPVPPAIPPAASPEVTETVETESVVNALDAAAPAVDPPTQVPAADPTSPDRTAIPAAEPEPTVQDIPAAAVAPVAEPATPTPTVPPPTEATPAPTMTPPPTEQPPKKRVPVLVWVIGSVLATVVVLGIWGLTLDDPTTTTPPPATAVDGTAATTPVTQAPLTGVVRPGEAIVAERITSVDGNGVPAWSSNPASVVFTDSVVFSDGWDGNVDLDTDWIFGWDDEFLYAEVFVDDDLHFQDQVNNRIFLGDSLNLDIDTDLAGDADVRPPNSDDFQILMVGDPTNGSSQSWLFQGNGTIFTDAPNQGGAVILVQEVGGSEAGSYAAQIRIPWSDLGVDPQPGMELGFRVSANDNDVQEARQEVMYSNVPNSSLFNTTTWGTLILN